MYPIKLCRFLVIKLHISAEIRQELDDINRYWEGRVGSRESDLFRLGKNAGIDDCREGGMLF